MYKILIVDDEETVRRIVRVALGDEGFTFCEAEDGETALHLIREEQPDLVLCDYEMPQLDGFELVRRMRNDDAMGKIPVVMLTVHDSYGRAMEGIEVGADDYVVKPFNPADLRKRVVFQLEKRAKRKGKNVRYPVTDTVDLGPPRVGPETS